MANIIKWKLIRRIVFWSILTVSAAALVWGVIAGDASFTRMEASTL